MHLNKVSQILSVLQSNIIIILRRELCDVFRHVASVRTLLLDTVGFVSRQVSMQNHQSRSASGRGRIYGHQSDYVQSYRWLREQQDLGHGPRLAGLWLHRERDG